MNLSHSSYDILIAGAGPVGCVLAERCATQLGWKVLLIDKRNHVAGNCYDRFHESGVMIHQYGPHYFRTNNKDLLDYLSQFTEWISGKYFVTSYTRNAYFPFPINLLTLAQFFGKDSLTPEEATALLESKREKIAFPKNSEEFVLSRVGKEMYEAFYLGYTLKQWDMHPRDLSPSVCGRIPIRLNNDCRYVDHTYQCTPKEGFTALFTKIVLLRDVQGRRWPGQSRQAARMPQRPGSWTKRQQCAEVQGWYPLRRLLHRLDEQPPYHHLVPRRLHPAVSRSTRRTPIPQCIIRSGLHALQLAPTDASPQGMMK